MICACSKRSNKGAKVCMEGCGPVEHW